MLHTDASLFDFATLAVARQAELSWNSSKHTTADLTFLNMTVGQAYARFFSGAGRKPEGYEDCHASVFTPASFALLVQECYAIGVSQLALDFVSTNHGDEFFAHLRLEHRNVINHHDRIQLLALSAIEQSDGYRNVKAARAPLLRRAASKVATSS